MDLLSLLLSNVYAIRFGVDCAAILKVILEFKWTSKGIWKVHVVKHASKEGAEAFCTPPPPLKFLVLGSQWEGSGRESLTRFFPLQLKLSGSADVPGWWVCF